MPSSRRLGAFFSFVVLTGLLACGGSPPSRAPAAESPTPGSVFPASVTRPRIMIVGDSISAGPGCYKKYLLEKLTRDGYTSFEFVGRYTDDCGGGVRHSAVSCSTAEHYTQETFTMSNCAQGTSFPGMSALMEAHRPDLVLVQLGVNDVWSGRSTQQILDSYATLVERARAKNPRVAVVVARIAKIRPDCTNDAVAAAAAALVDAVPAWARAVDTAQSRVLTADLWTDSDASKAETNDCVHPNDAGARRMGANWYAALAGLLPK